MPVLSSLLPENGAVGEFFASFSNDSLRGRFARGATWSLVGAVISQGLGLVASVITARLLGREDFGALGMIQSTVGMLGIFAGLGLGLTATKYVAELREKDAERTGGIIGLSYIVATATGGIVSTVLFLVAPFLAARTLNAPHLAAELRIASAFLFLSAVTGMQTGVLSGFEAFRAIAQVNLVRGVLNFPIMIAAVVFWRLPGAVWAMVAAAAIGWLLNHSALRRECLNAGVRPRMATAWAERPVLWKFSVPAFLSSAVAGPGTWVANTMLVNQPNGYAEMGIFSAASLWRTAVSFVPSTLSQPLLAMLSCMRGKNEMKSYRRAIWLNVGFVFCLTTGIAASIALAAPFVVKAYGSEFARVKPVLILMMLVAVISSTAAVIGQAIASSAKMWAGLVLNCIWVLALLFASRLLVARLGAVGLAAATLGAYVVHAVTVSAYTWRSIAGERNT